MPTERSVWVAGAGGLARGVVDALRLSGRNVAGLIVHPGADAAWFGGATITDDELSRLSGPFELVVAIGDNARRKEVSQRYAGLIADAVFSTVIHPSAVVSETAIIGAGSIVLGSVNIGPAAVVGVQVLLYTGTIVEHDCHIADFASTGPGAVLGGGVTVGAASFIGLGARVTHGKVIGSDSVVGLGAVVTRNVPDRVIAVGSPARMVRARQHGEPYL